MKVEDSRLVTGKTMFECLYEPFTKRRRRADRKDEEALFSAVELSPHIFVTMGPVNKPDKYIAICMHNDTEDCPFILKSIRVDDFDRENAEMNLHLLMLDFFRDYMVEDSNLREAFGNALEEAVEYVSPADTDADQEE